jgi:hypothetical protein
MADDLSEPVLNLLASTTGLARHLLDDLLTTEAGRQFVLKSLGLLESQEAYINSL